MLFGVDGKAGPLALFSPPKDMLYWLRNIYPHERFVQRLSFVGWGSERAPQKSHHRSAEGSRPDRFCSLTRS